MFGSHHFDVKHIYSDTKLMWNVYVYGNQ